MLTPISRSRAVITVSDAANEAGMLALSGVRVGDMCRRTDLADVMYVLRTLPASTLSNWTALAGMDPAAVDITGGTISGVTISTSTVNNEVDSSGYSTINAAVTAIGATPTTLVVSTAETLAANITFPATLTLVIQQGGSLVKASSYTVTINGPFVAGLYRVFSGFSNGDVVFAPGTVEKVIPEWWYVGSGSWHTAIQCAIDSLNAEPGLIFLANKTYNMTSGVTITSHRQHIVGSGAQVTYVSFVPIASAVAFTIGNVSGTPQLVANSIKGIGFTSSDTTFKKTMLRVYNVNKMHIEDLMSPDGKWTGDTSVGLNLCGSDAFTIERLQISADIPIHISANPSSGPTVDHFAFRDIYLYATDSTNPCVKIDTGVLLQNMIWEGYNGFARGSYGIYWLDTTGLSSALNFSFKNIRWEQSENNSGYFFFIEKTNSALYQLNIENCYTASGTYTYGFMRLKNVRYITVQNSTHFCIAGASGIYAYMSGVISALSFKNFMTLGTLDASNTDPTLTKIYDSYDYSPGISVIGTHVMYSHYPVGPIIPYPSSAEIGVLNNDLRTYGAGRGLIMTNTAGTLTKRVRLNNTGDGLVYEDVSVTTPPPPPGSSANLITAWTNYGYETFTATGADIATAQQVGTGNDFANTSIITVEPAHTYRLTATLTIDGVSPGQLPTLSWVSVAPTSQILANGANVIDFVAGAAQTLTSVLIQNTAAAKWACTFELIEHP